MVTTSRVTTSRVIPNFVSASSAIPCEFSNRSGQSRKNFNTVSQAPNQSSLVASGHHDVFGGPHVRGQAIRVTSQQRPRLASDAESCPCWDHRWPHSEGGRNTSCSWMRRFICGFNRLPGLCVSSNFGPLLHHP